LTTLMGDLNPHYAVWGHLFHYIYTSAAGGWLALQLAAGRHASWLEAVAAQHVDPWAFIWCGRAVSAALGVATLVVTARLARRATGSRTIGVAACLILSTLYLHVRDSHFATCDILLALNSTAAIAVLSGRGRLRAGWAGFWTGLALASKLLAVSVVLSFLTVLIIDWAGRRDWTAWKDTIRATVVFGATTAAVALATQPFLVLDPMETWYGLFDDLFNPERRPFQGGLKLRNASILARYYLPQATGWLVGGLAVAGGLIGLALAARRLCRRMPSRPLLAPLIFVGWSLLPLVSVERIFLRYLDPVLPAACVLAATAIGWGVRRVAWTGWQRAVAIAASAVIVAAPNGFRSVLLDHRLMQQDTRAAAGRWIERHVGPHESVFWSGYEAIAPHLTMPWLEAPLWHDRAHAALRASRGLPTAVEEAVTRRKQPDRIATHRLYGLVLGADAPVRSGFEVYAMLDPRSPRPWLERWDAWCRRTGLLRRESPRWEWMRRRVLALYSSTTESLVSAPCDIVVLTGMPVDPQLVRRMDREFVEVQRYEPGVDWSELGGRVMYDTGDAWYLPNWGLHRVARPGPQVVIYARRAATRS
jgi:hypothetical protein